MCKSRLYIRFILKRTSMNLNLNLKKFLFSLLSCAIDFYRTTIFVYIEMFAIQMRPFGCEDDIDVHSEMDTITHSDSDSGANVDSDTNATDSDPDSESDPDSDSDSESDPDSDSVEVEDIDPEPSDESNATVDVDEDDESIDVVATKYALLHSSKDASGELHDWYGYIDQEIYSPPYDEMPSGHFYPTHGGLC